MPPWSMRMSEMVPVRIGTKSCRNSVTTACSSRKISRQPPPDAGRPQTGRGAGQEGVGRDVQHLAYGNAVGVVRQQASLT